MNRFRSKKDFFVTVLKDRYPSASASVIGSPEYPDINGSVNFYATPLGVIVSAEIFGLPSNCEGRSCIFGFHIHEGQRCLPSDNDPIGQVGAHYAKGRTSHPHHAGDLPPLLSNDGYAWLATLTNRFQIEDIVGRTIIIHSQPDDFTTQPSGNSGAKIACGEIV